MRPRDPQLGRELVEPRRAALQRGVEQVLAVDVQHVEEERRHAFERRVDVDLRHRVLEGGRAVRAHPQRLAVEDRLGHRQPADRVGDPGQRVGDLVEVPRVDADLVTAAMDLNADPVQLPFH